MKTSLIIFIAYLKSLFAIIGLMQPLLCLAMVLPVCLIDPKDTGLFHSNNWWEVYFKMELVMTSILAAVTTLVFFAELIFSSSIEKVIAETEKFWNEPIGPNECPFLPGLYAEMNGKWAAILFFPIFYFPIGLIIACFAFTPESFYPDYPDDDTVNSTHS